MLTKSRGVSNADTLADMKKGSGDLDKQLNLRASAGDVDRLDRLAEALANRTPGVEITRSGAARAAILRGLDALEAELGLAKKKKH